MPLSPWKIHACSPYRGGTFGERYETELAIQCGFDKGAFNQSVEQKKRSLRTQFIVVPIPKIGRYKRLPGERPA